MTTIDDLFHELDIVKARYDKKALLQYFFEFACQFAEHNDLPRYQITYDAIISWKLAVLVKHTQMNYNKDKSFAYQELKVPQDKSISKTILEYETKNWNAYWKRMSHDISRPL